MAAMRRPTSTGWRSSARRSDAMSGRRSGSFDQRSEVGMFEDDYEDRLRASGYRVVCADELFVHRFGGGFAKSGGADSEPEAIARRIEEAVRRNFPEGSTVLVVSRGEDGHADLDGYEVWHFPQLDDDDDAGSHTTDQEAIAELEELRKRGAEYLLVPATENSWLERHEVFRRHLERYALQNDDPDSAVICDLGQSGEARTGEGRIS